MKLLDPSPARAAAYVALYPLLLQVAKRHGYALAVHGSLHRDFDFTVLTYSGKAQVFEGQEKRVIKVVFSEPKTLPSHYHFEAIETPKGTD